MHSNKDIIIVARDNTPLINGRAGFDSKKMNSSIFNESILPTYTKSFFPKQREILLKGGIFPHYMLGYINLENKEFELNTHFFSTPKTFKEILINGFDIAQSSFHQKLKETDYESFFYIDPYGDLDDSILHL